MTVSVFQDFIAQTAQAIGIETESADPYQQVFELAERCEESDQSREKLDEYSKFLFKSLKIDCKAKNQWDDIAPEVLQYVFIAILRGIYAATGINDATGEKVNPPRKQHWLPVALLKQFPPSRVADIPPTPSQARVRAQVVCSVANPQMPMQTVVNDQEFIHEEDYYYDTILEYMFAFTEGAYGNAVKRYKQVDSQSTTLDMVMYAGFAILSYVRLPLAENTLFSPGDVKTVLSKVFSIFDYMGAMYPSLAKTKFQLPFSPFSQPYTVTGSDGNMTFVYPIGLRIGFALSTKRSFVRETADGIEHMGFVKFLKQYRRRSLDRAFVKQDIVLGVENIGMHLRDRKEVK